MPWWGTLLSFTGFGVWTVVCIAVGAALVQQKTTVVNRGSIRENPPNGRN